MQFGSPITREMLLDYFLEAAKPREQWQVGMELERMGRAVADGTPIPYDGDGASVLSVLRAYLERRQAAPVLEADYLIGLDAVWGSITLEPGGQVEWSSKPRRELAALKNDLDAHVTVMDEIGDALGVRWLDHAVEPELPVSAMPWMPKARYKIMRPYLGARGRLAHRMMTQTASIQCAFDFGDADDWRRKFLAAARLAPVATALFANSSRVDGRDSGFRSYRQAIWRETDPARCSLPPVVFEKSFSLESWLDWVLHVPTIFRHRSRGLVPAGGVPFVELLERTGCDAVHPEDWITHVSTIFTEVRSYTYIEVRSADLQPAHLAFAVPAFWTGLLYNETALDAALDLGAGFSRFADWNVAMETASCRGLDGVCGTTRMRDLASRAVALAVDGLQAESRWHGDPAAAVGALRALASERGIDGGAEPSK